MSPDALPLFVWLSPAFPVGAFAYSHGLEWAVEVGDVSDAATAREWIADLIAHGSVRSDAILLAAAMKATPSPQAIAKVNELALALSPSRERRLETVSQGSAFRDLIRNVWNAPASTGLPQSGEVAYPVAVGVAAATHGLAVETTLQAFIVSVVSNLVSAVVRLGPIGQTESQRIIAALLPAGRACAAFAASATPDDLGSACIRADIASMKHETQYSRLFRS